MEFDRKAFSNILKTLRDYYGSVAKLARAADVDRTYLSKYINFTTTEPPSAIETDFEVRDISWNPQNPSIIIYSYHHYI